MNDNSKNQKSTIMKTTKFIFAIILVSIFVVFNSCQKEKEESLVLKPTDTGVLDYTNKEYHSLLKSATINGIYPNGMVAYWKFEEGSGITATDCVNGHVGILNNGPVWVDAIVGKGMLFNGVNAVVEVPYHPDFNPGDQFALEAWGYLYAPGDKNHDTFISKMSLPSQDLLVSYQFWVSVGNWLAVDYELSDGWHEFYTDSDIFELNKWNHIVFTKNEGLLNLYYNGELVKTDVGFDNLPQTEGNLGIGANYGGWGSFNGILDEVAIYNRVLTLDEIQEHYQNGLNGLGYEKPVVQAIVDFHPNKLNLKRMGKTVTVYIELPEDYNLADINIGTVKLEGIIPAESYPFEVGDYDNDNILDLKVKFNSKALIEYLDGETGEVTLLVSGETNNGSLFEGKDLVNLIKPGKN